MLCKGYLYRHERSRNEGKPYVATRVYGAAQHVLKHYMGGSSGGSPGGSSSGSPGGSSSGSPSDSSSGSSSSSPSDSSSGSSSGTSSPNNGSSSGSSSPGSAAGRFFHDVGPRTMHVVFVLRGKGQDRELLNGEELLQQCRQWRPSIPRLSARLTQAARQHADDGVRVSREAVGHLAGHIQNLTLTAHALSSALQAADRAPLNGAKPLDEPRDEVLARAVARVALALQACHIRVARTEAVLAFLEARLAAATAAAGSGQHEMVHQAGGQAGGWAVHAGVSLSLGFRVWVVAL